MDCVLGLAFPCFYRKLHSFFSRGLGGRGAEASAEEHGADSGPGSGLPPEAPRATLEHAHSFSGGRTSYIIRCRFLTCIHHTTYTQPAAATVLPWAATARPRPRAAFAPSCVLYPARRGRCQPRWPFRGPSSRRACTRCALPPTSSFLPLRNSCTERV